MQTSNGDPLMRQRTQVINALRAHMAELGIVATVPAMGLWVGVSRRHQVHAMTN